MLNSPTWRFPARAEKGDGVDWTAISISYVHNALVANETLRFSAKVNGSLGREESTSCAPASPGRDCQ